MGIRVNSLRRAGVLLAGAVYCCQALAQVQEIVVTARKRAENLQEVPLSISALSAEQLQQRGLSSDQDISNFTIGFRTLKQTGRDIDRPIIRGMSAPASRGNPNASYFLDGTYVSGSVSTATTSVVERVEVLRGPQSAQFGRATFSGAINYVTRKPTDEFQGQANTKAGSSDEYNVGGWVSGPIIADRLLFLASANWSNYGGQWRNQLQANPNNLTDNGGAYFTTVIGKLVPLSQFVNPPQQGDNSRLGAESTLDFLGKLTWRVVEGTEVNFKYAYTEGTDSHFPSLIFSDLNCYLPPADGKPVAGVPGSGTTGGAYCGYFTARGKINRINIPDMENGITLIRAPSPGQTQADVTAAPADPGAQRKTHRFLLDLDQDIGRMRLTARGAWNKDTFEQAFDLDHTEVRGLYNLFTFDNHRATRDYSAETRLATPTDLPVRGQAGLYYFNSIRKSQIRSFPGPSAFLGSQLTCQGQIYYASTTLPRPTVADTQNKAVFGEVDWDFADRWTLSLEGRYGRDDVKLSGGNCESGRLSFSKFTPRITLRWQPEPDLNFYFLVAKGNKPGDFNTEYYRADIVPATTHTAQAKGDDIIKEEEQLTFEVGAKTAWLDRRITANLSVYTIDWRNQSLFTVITVDNGGTPFSTTVLRNAGKSRIEGLELETNYAITDNFSVIANYGYTHAVFLSGNDSFLADTTGDGNIAGRRIPSVPEHNIILGALVTRSISHGRKVFLRSDLAIESDRTTDATEFGKIGNRMLANVRYGIEAEHWTTTLYVANLLDDQTPVAALQFLDLSPAGVISPPTANPQRDSSHFYKNMWGLNPQRGRDIGVEFQYRF